MESEAFEVASEDSLLEIYYSLEMPLLRRPISECRFEQDLGLVSECYKVEDEVGKLAVKAKRQELEVEDVKKHFDKPIAQAAKEVGIGLTHFKKRCRQLGIKRWPHRKIRSLNYLIHNLKEFGSKDELNMLEEQRRMVEKKPEIELSERAMKNRQKTFKANYHRKRNMTISQP